jgi:hypothetical protein
MARIVKGAGLLVLVLLIAFIGVWGALLLWYTGPGNDLVRMTLAAGFALASAGSIVALARRLWRRGAVGTFAVLFTGLLILWSSLEPSNDGDWQVYIKAHAQTAASADLLP